MSRVSLLTHGLVARCVLLVALLVSLGTPLPAQVDISAQLLGTVQDASGGVVPNGRIEARNQQTGVTSRAFSDDSGTYQFTSLPAGTYTVACTKESFKTFVASEIVLQSQRVVTLPIVLQVVCRRER